MLQYRIKRISANKKSTAGYPYPAALKVNHAEIHFSVTIESQFQ